MKKPAAAPREDVQLVSQMRTLLDRGQLAVLEVFAANLCESRPDFGPAWHFHGLANLRLGRAEQACASLERATQCMPGNPDAWDHLGIAYSAAKRADAAVGAFESALAADPRRASTLTNLSKLALEAGNHVLAEQHARKALTLRPGLLQASIHLALALNGQARHQEAVSITSALLKLAPQTPELLAAHARCASAIADGNAQDGHAPD